MTTLQEEDLNALSDLLTIRDAKGHIAISVGLIVTVYFENPCLRAAREAVAGLAEQYVHTYRPNLVWITNRKWTRLHKLESDTVPMPWTWLAAQPDAETWQFGLHGATREDDASPFQISGLGIAHRKEDLGYFRIHLPLRWLADHPGAFPALVLNICESIRPVSGYAGIGFQLPMTHEGTYEAEKLLPPLTKRFPGVEVDDPVQTGIHLEGGGIKGVNWLTILHDRYLPELGGLDYLRIRLPESTFPFYKYDGGLIIQAGPFPEVGDTTQNRWPKHYVTVARVLKKIQLKEHYGFFSKRRGMMDNETTRAWIHRFDNK